MKVIFAVRVIFGRRGVVIAAPAPAVVVGEAVVLPVGQCVPVVPVEQLSVRGQGESVAECADRHRAALHREGKAVCGLGDFERSVARRQIFDHAGSAVAVGEGRDNDAVAAVRADEVHALGEGAGAERRFAPAVRLDVIGAHRARALDREDRTFVRLRSRHRRKAVAAHDGVFCIRPGSDVLREGGVARLEFLPRHVACGGMDHGCFDLPREKKAGKQLRKQKDRRKRHAEECHAEPSEEGGLFRSVHGNHLIHHILLQRARPVNVHMTGSKMEGR